MPGVAARAGVHRRNELKARREIRPPPRTRHADVTGFQRFAQGFEHPPVKLGEFIKKQNAVVRE